MAKAVERSAFLVGVEGGAGGRQKGGDEDEYPEDDLDELYSSDFEDDEEEELEHCTSSVLFRGHKSAVSATCLRGRDGVGFRREGYGRGRLGRVRGERFVSVERTPRASDERGVRDERDGR